MEKKSKKRHDEDITNVLAELQRNCKQDLDKIAKHCGFSRQKAWRIIKQLETDGYIWGYTAITNDEKRNLSQFTILIKKTSQPIEKTIVEKIDSITLEDFVADMDVTIQSSCFVHGNYDWLIMVITPDIQHVRKFCEALYKAFPGAIEKIDVLQTLYTVRNHYIFNPDRKKLHDLL